MFNLMHKDGMNKSFISIFALCVAAISVTVSCTSDKYVSITGYAQGGSYVVKLNLQGRDGRIGVSPEKIKAGIDSVTVALDNSLSGYNDKSLLTRFNNGERIVPDSIFADIYRISYGFFEETGGAFDVAAGPLFDIWGFGFKEGSMPSDEMVAEVRESCGMRALYPDISGRVADDGSVCSSDMVKDDAPRKYGKPRLNFNAIAQGYTCDIVADYLYSNKKENEGEMTKVRASYVCENALYEYSMSLGLNNYIKVGHGEEKEGGKFKKAIVADIFEALIGAIYLDLGYATARKTVLNIIVPYIENPDIVFFSDYKSALQEYVQTSQQSLHYELIKEEGPAHNKRFTVQVKIDGIVYGTGVSGSKKEAEQEAAKIALDKLAI